MLRKNLVLIAVFLSALILVGALGTAADAAEKPKIAAPCKQCHTPDDKVLRGGFAGISPNAQTIQIAIGPATWLVKYDGDTKLTGEEKWSKIPKEKEIAVSITEKDGVLYATSVAVKPPAKIAPEKIIKADELAKLVAMGGEKGEFSLVDSRPAPKYSEGYIPGAISIYDALFEKNTDKLPKDKAKLLIFYCAGVT